MDYLNHPETDRIIDNALREDIGSGDHTTLSTIPAGARATAQALVKEGGLICGIAVAEKVFRRLDPAIEFEALMPDGDRAEKGELAFRVRGSIHAILSGERLALNIMQRMSGIATYTRSMVNLIEGTGCRLLDTRKTTPGFRHFEKWAVLMGGGVNHRTGLYDMILIKDNHIDFAGGIGPALRGAQEYLKRSGLNLKIEIEIRRVAEVEEVFAAGGAHRLLLDNMNADEMREAVKLVAGRCETEGSGGIDEHTIREKAMTGVDYLSMGALTHRVRSLDISLDAVPEKK